jgi:hypothetical protein
MLDSQHALISTYRSLREKIADVWRAERDLQRAKDAVILAMDEVKQAEEQHEVSHRYHGDVGDE